MLVGSLLLIIGVLYLILELFVKNRNYWKKRNVTEVKGVTWEFMRGKKSLSEIYKDIYYAYPNEDNIGFYSGIKPALMIKNLENVQAVLHGDFQSFFGRGILLNDNDLLGDSILFMDDYERWKLVRHKISPVFTMRKLKNMFNIMEQCARDFVKYIDENPEAFDKSFDVLYNYTTAALAASVFGIDKDAKSTMHSPLIDMVRKASKPTLLINMKTTLANTFPKIFKLLKIRVFGEYEDFFIGVVKKVLRERRKNNEKKYDFIDTCIELQNGGVMQNLETGYQLVPSDELMAGQAFFFFIAGADTSAQSMNFTLLELAGNPDILKRLHKEIDEVFDKCKEVVTINELEELKYMDMVLNEAFRKYPAVGLFQRDCTKPTTLPVGQIKIEKDVVVVVPTFAIHRDERYYPNPELFDPERFSPENIGNIPKYSYLPFGEGNRSCIGARFARLQMKIGLAWLLRRYTLEEQVYKPRHFEPSSFGLRDTKTHIYLIPRELWFEQS